MTLWRHWDAVYISAALAGHTDKIISSTLSDDGKIAVTGSLDNTARVWDTETGKELARLDCDDDVYFVTLSSDKKILVTASMNTVVQVWSLAEKGPILNLKGYTDLARPSLTADGRLLAVPFQSELKIVDAHTGDPLLRCRDSANLISCRFSPDGNLLVGASNSGPFVVFDARSGDIQQGRTGKGFPIAFSKQRLLTLNDSGIVRVIGTKDWNELTQIGTGRYETEGQIAGAVFSDDENTIYTLSWDGLLSAWSSNDGHRIERLTRESISDRTLRGSDDGTVLLTMGNGQVASIWRWRRSIGLAGLVWLPELWLTLFSSLAMLISFKGDRKQLRNPIDQAEVARNN